MSLQAYAGGACSECTPGRVVAISISGENFGPDGLPILKYTRTAGNHLRLPTVGNVRGGLSEVSGADAVSVLSEADSMSQAQYVSKRVQGHCSHLPADHRSHRCATYCPVSGISCQGPRDWPGATACILGGSAKPTEVPSVAGACGPLVLVKYGSGGSAGQRSLAFILGNMLSAGGRGTLHESCS